jgi:hypothetical protein
VVLFKHPFVQHVFDTQTYSDNHQTACTVYMYTIYIQYIRSGDKIKKNKMNGACSVYEGEERRIQGFGGKT